MKIYNAAVVGCGRAGFLYDLDPKRKEISTHTGAYINSPYTKLKAVVDTNPERLEKVKNHLAVNKLYTDASIMFDHEKIDIISICTEPQSHQKLVEQSIQSGVRAIFCEKPIDVSLKAAKKIVNLCQEANILLAVNHFRRWDQFHIDVCDWVKKGGIGDIQHCMFIYNNGILNTGSHIFDLLRMFFGEIKSLQSHHAVYDFGQDPTITGMVEFQSGITTNLIGCNANYYRIFEMDILGTKGRIKIHNGYDMELLQPEPSLNNSEFQILSHKPPLFFNGRKGFYLKAIENIVNTIENKANIYSSGEDAFKALEAVVASVVSLRNQKKINLPLTERYYNLNML